MHFLSLRKMALPAGAEHATGYTHIWKILLYKKWLFGIDDLAMSSVPPEFFKKGVFGLMWSST